MVKACVLCHKEGVQGGYPVEEDAVIKGIRAVKQKLGIAKNNVLVVEEGCLEAAKEKRKKFERDIAIHMVLAAAVLLIFAFVFLTSGFPFLTLLFGLLLAGMIMALAVFSHFPKIADAALVQQKTGAKGAAQSSGAARNKRKGRK